MSSENKEGEKWALLIGINYYIPGKNPSNVNLKGCVEDINRVETYLRNTQGLKASNIVKLTATSPTGNQPRGKPTEPEASWPTYQNIRNALKALADNGKAGDLVYLHYSGHGTRAQTNHPELKGEGGMDEAIVPTDFRSGGSLLRDYEMAYWLDRVVQKKLVFTVVLDSCNSAGAVRGGTAVDGRGITGIDDLMSPDPIPDIPLGMLAPIWDHQQLMGGHVKENWLLEAYGYEFLAACRPNELANESNYDGKIQGVLTYRLLETLKSGGTNITHRMIHRKVYDDVHSEYSKQAPVLSGKVERRFFSSIGGDDKPIHTISIARPSHRNSPNTIQLRGGAAHDISRGSEYAIYPWNASDLTDPGSRMGRAIVTGVSGLISEAQIIGDPIPTLPSGCQAVPLGRPTQTRMKLLRRTDLPGDIHQAEVLDQVRQMDWKKYGSGVVPLVLVSDDDNGPVSYNIVVNDRSEYELWDAEGKPFPNLAASSNPETILISAAHLTRFLSIRNLKNTSVGTNSLKDNFKFELLGKEQVNGVYEITEGEPATVQFTNLAEDVVNLTVFDYGSTYGITQIYPENTHYETVDPDGTCKLDLDMTPGTNTIRAFITIRPTSFRTFEMPDISAGSNIPSTWTGEPLEKLADTTDTSADLDVQNPLLRDWETAEIKIHTSPKASS